MRRHILSLSHYVLNFLFTGGTKYSSYGLEALSFMFILQNGEDILAGTTQNWQTGFPFHGWYLVRLKVHFTISKLKESILGMHSLEINIRIAFVFRVTSTYDTMSLFNIDIQSIITI